MSAEKPGALTTLRRHGWFLTCLAMLIVLVVGFEVRFRNMVIVKLPLPLKKSLGQLDRSKLTFTEDGKKYSYRLEGQPVQLEPEMVDKLGTTEYISWTMRLWDETTQQPTDKAFHLFVTYYTGKPDQVPHVPEECYLGNAFEAVDNHLDRVALPSLPEKDQVAPLQVLLFKRGGNSVSSRAQSQLVMYTFRVCDEWHAEREEVRRTLGNPFATHAYFSKVELGFALPPGQSEEALKLATEEGRRCMSVVLPVLMADHWPVWPTDRAQSSPTVTNSNAGQK